MTNLTVFKWYKSRIYILILSDTCSFLFAEAEAALSNGMPIFLFLRNLFGWFLLEDGCSNSAFEDTFGAISRFWDNFSSGCWLICIQFYLLVCFQVELFCLLFAYWGRIVTFVIDFLRLVLDGCISTDGNSTFSWFGVGVERRCNDGATFAIYFFEIAEIEFQLLVVFILALRFLWWGVVVFIFTSHCFYFNFHCGHLQVVRTKCWD